MTDADAAGATGRIVRAAAAGIVCAAISGCTAPSPVPAEAYYRYDFIAAREELRPLAAKVDNDLVLNELRLGMAGLADGNVNETEAALGRVFDLLSTAGLNKDRTAAAALVYEGVRIWKGEPFEQALAYYWVAAHYASRGDWENARAAAANALFRLTDFGADMDAEKVAREAAQDESYLDEGYTAVDSNFALGFLMQAIGADLTGAGGASEQFDAALRIDPDLGTVVDALRSRRFDTLLIVDYGRGPQKIAYGPDNALTKFVSRERSKGPLRVTADGDVLGELPAVCDVEQMAFDLRWNNLEDIRRAKSAIGNVLTIGGGTAAVIGGSQNSDAAVIAGLGAVALGLLLKASAQADVRYLDFAPASIYLVPLRLNAPADIELAVVGAPAARVVLPAFQPGTERAPRTVYLRLLGTGSPAPEWLVATDLLYGNDHTGVRPGDRPWILEGADVGTPSRERLEAYQAGGALVGWNITGLREAYASNGIVLGAGMDDRSDADRARSFRHILDGGSGLFTPQPDTMGYKRLMYRPARVFPPRSGTAPPAATLSP